MLIFWLLLFASFAQPLAAQPGCARYRVAPSETNATDSFNAAMQAASRDAARDVLTPAGGQTRVYLPAGVYALDEIQVASNVRFEFDPGAVVRPRPSPTTNADIAVFTLGTLTAAARNVTFAAGDGCGGPGAPVGEGGSAYKPAQTSFRGNAPGETRFGTRGMANAAIPFRDFWRAPVGRMWVLDLDPRATGASSQITGFYIRHAYDVWIENVFTIQNAENRNTAAGGAIDGVTGRTAAMMIQPPRGVVFDPRASREDWVMPHRIHVDWHYNILSVSGQGNVQVRGCLDCTFRYLFSHGGVPFRVETDGLRAGEFSMVDNTSAEWIEGAYGNAVALITPHRQVNGSVMATNLLGTSMYSLVSMAGPEDDSGGRFSMALVINGQVCPGEQAQRPDPANNAFVLEPSRSALSIAPAATWARAAGFWEWPSRLANGVFPAGAGFGIQNPPDCALGWKAIPVRRELSVVALASTGGTLLAPGALLSLYGTNLTAEPATAAGALPFPRTINHTAVVVNNGTAPLLYVSPGQINFQMPIGTSTGSPRIELWTQGELTGSLNPRMAPASPGLFSAAGRSIVQNQDYSLNGPGNPARPGEIAITYLTGQGQTEPPVVDGEAAPASPLARVAAPVRVAVGGRDAEVLFAGLTPGFAGLCQVNFRIPAGLDAGSYPLQVVIGGAQSPAGVVEVGGRP